MQKKICAVTVSSYYLERRKFAVKYLIVAYRQTGEAFWFVQTTDTPDLDKHKLEGEAIKYAITHFVPFVPNIKHGDHVNNRQSKRLVKYGVTV